ncbi:MAG: L,D-transpeptidase [Lachnospiraceae bacterium]|nr:L,D-transpeptidase [Lachnospiraceae bacterium]
MSKDKFYEYFAVFLITVVVIAMGIIMFVNSKNSNSSAHADKTTKNEVISSDNKNLIEDKSDEDITSEIESATEEATTTNYKKLINFKADYPFMIKVNLAKQWVCVYGLDWDGHYSVPYKIFVCSSGRNAGSTPTGAFTIYEKYEWRMMVDNSFAQYAVRFNGPIMFHSVPYYSTHKNDLEVEEYNKLGTPASLGCVRLNVKSVKWIYDHCTMGTKVIVYSMKNEKAPLELPKLKKAKSKGKLAGWDPTDPDANNPWKEKSAGRDN